MPALWGWAGGRARTGRRGLPLPGISRAARLELSGDGRGGCYCDSAPNGRAIGTETGLIRGQEREVKVICFARLCEEDVIKVGSTGDLPSRFLSKLKGKFGPVREVTWLDDDVEPNEGMWRALDRRFNFGQRFDHL